VLPAFSKLDVEIISIFNKAATITNLKHDLQGTGPGAKQPLSVLGSRFPLDHVLPTTSPPSVWRICAAPRPSPSIRRRSITKIDPVPWRTLRMLVQQWRRWKFIVRTSHSEVSGSSVCRKHRAVLMCLVVVPACCMLLNVVIPKLSGTTSRQRVLEQLIGVNKKWGQIHHHTHASTGNH
jgi:hypothetical protein